MRVAFMALVGLLWGCPSDVADRETFACEVHQDCRSGFACGAEGVCRAGSIPADVGVVDGGPVDATVADAEPPEDAGPPEDARPVDAAPPRDARPPVDTDGDGVDDDRDNCPDVANPNQSDADRDGVGDACEPDTDRDGVYDDLDNCPALANANQIDRDADGVGDACDNCPDDPNPDQRDANADGRGDVCEGPDDPDRDGWLNANDNCPDLANPDQADRNGNGVGDACEVRCNQDADCQLPLVECDAVECGGAYIEKYFRGRCSGPGAFCDAFEPEPIIVNTINCAADSVCHVEQNIGRCAPDADRCPPVDRDADGDGIGDAIDNCPADANADQADLDRDGRGDACDVDRDGDGVINADDSCPDQPNADQADRNDNAIGDACEVPCDLAGGTCVLPMPHRCDDAAACGGVYSLMAYEGVCDGGVCGGFGEQPEPVVRDRCQPGELCQVGAQAPCAPDVSCAPVQGPCRADTVGRACRFTTADCVDAAPPSCGGAFLRRVFTGICDVDARCSDAEQIGDDQQAQCEPTEACVPGNDASVSCVPTVGCGRMPMVCGPELEGAHCYIFDTPERFARCVDGVCQAWDCANPECNELGPRRFSPDSQLRAEGERFLEVRPDLIWALVPDQPMVLVEAHVACQGFVDGANWRLPTMYELLSLAARDNQRRLELVSLEVDDGVYISRTAIGDGAVYGVSLLDGLAGPIDWGNADGHRVACVHERNPTGGDAWDLTARRQAFTDWGGAVLDPLTDLEWSLPAPGEDGVVVMGNRAQAQAACEGNGAALPTVEEIASVLTFNGGQAPNSPGVWLAYDGNGFQQAEYSIWASEPSMVVGDSWTVNLQTGAAETLDDGMSLKVVCVRGPNPNGMQ